MAKETKEKVSADIMHEQKKPNIYELIEAEIRESDSSLEEKNKKLSKLANIRNMKLNIMLVGATGVGKSSTINALFDMGVAKVGNIDPETTTIQKYELENIVIWDTPGFGDSIRNDKTYMELIRNKLSEHDKDGIPVIDLVVVILDAASRDLGTAYSCINEVIIPALGNEAKERVLICLNRSDLALNARHWNDDLNQPDKELTAYLEKKVESIGKRIYASTGISFDPVYYCAGYSEGNIIRKPYNLSKLLYAIVATLPREKRLALVNAMNPDSNMFDSSDNKKDYKDLVRNKLIESIKDYSCRYAEKGLEIGIWVAGVHSELQEPWSALPTAY